MSTTTITDVIALRAGDLTRIIAGCIAISPLAIMPILEGLADGIFVDPYARRFIVYMQDNLDEIKGINEQQQTDFIVEYIKRRNLMFSYLTWLSVVGSNDVIGVAKKAVRELKKLAIALDTFNNLQIWYKENVNVYYG